jgi:L-ascorbate metabolism protein UlaG (beta-lactamase superfamily)
MDGAEAARVAKEAGARLAIPCHYDMFEFNTAATDDFVATCGSLRQPCRALRAGERLTIKPQRPLRERGRCAPRL